MAIEKIKIGGSANDGSGDPLRVAFEKINVSLDDLTQAVAARLLPPNAFAPFHHDHHDLVPRYLGQSAPDEPPTVLGGVWIDCSKGHIYIAGGTDVVADWRRVKFEADAPVPDGG